MNVFPIPIDSMVGCTNSLTKWVLSKLFVLGENPLLSILVHVISQMFVYNGEEGRAHLNLHSGLPHSPCICWWGAHIADSEAVGTSILVMKDKHLKNSVFK